MIYTIKLIIKFYKIYKLFLENSKYILGLGLGLGLDTYFETISSRLTVL